MRLIVDFDIKTDPNTDLIPAQMRQNLASSQLPTSVTNHGVTVQRTAIAPLMLVSLYSQHGTYDAKFLVNYAYINLNDQLTRVPGIGSVQVFGAGQYAMRLWVKPDQLTKLAWISHRVCSSSRSAAQPGIYFSEGPKTTYTSATCIMPKGAAGQPRPPNMLAGLSFVALRQCFAWPTGPAKYFN